MFSVFRCGLWLVFALLLACRLVLAQPQLPNYAPLVTGHVRYVVAGEGLVALPGATIEVWLKRTLVMQTQSGGDGAFRLDRLPNPATPDDGFVVIARPARADNDLGAAATAFVLEERKGNALPNVEIVLEPAKTRPIRIVTLADGSPVVGAKVSVLSLSVALPDGGGNWTIPASGIAPQMSDTSGTADLTGVPAGAMAELQASRDEYADNIVRLKKTEAGATIPLALESRVYGRVTLDGKEPLDVPQWQIKMQGMREPWRNHWRISNLNGKGEYVIQNVAPPEIIGESSYLINLELNKIFDPRAGVHAEYVPKGGYDVMVTTDRDGEKRRYISYIAQSRSLLKFGEGSDVRHDFDLEPLALIVGQTQPGATISYDNPRSRYRTWRQVAGADGRFEMPVPIGDVQLQVGALSVNIEALKAHETRDLTALLKSASLEAIKRVTN